MDIFTPIEKLPRIGVVFQKRLKKLGIHTVQDLLFYFPHRYEDFSNISSISQIAPNQNYCIQGKLLEINSSQTSRKKMSLTQAIIEDHTGAIKTTWFNQPYLAKSLKKDDKLYLVGKARLGNDGLYLSNPSYEKVSSFKFPAFAGAMAGRQASGLTHAGRLVPVYSETAGLSSRWLRWILKSILSQIQNKIPEALPAELIKEHSLLPIKRAIAQIHFPESLSLAKKAKERFSFEELFYIALFVLQQKAKLAYEKGISIPFNLDLTKKFVKLLPFTLTDAQRKSTWQIFKNLEKAMPMNRLLEGDVGSGKTVVALLAALNTAKAGFQVAFMAPTEILSKQHFKESAKLLQDFKLNIGFLTGKQDKFISKKLKQEPIEISRAKLLERVGDGEIDILIGTHALIQDKVKFKNLALVILDEQHRFGVKQRAKLCQNQQFIPHLLSMTATPIPRTLALTVYGDLDISLLDELPKHRKKIITKVADPAHRKETYQFIKKQVNAGRQVFVICPRIEENKKENSSWADVKAVEQEYEKLAQEIFPNLKIAKLHGKLTTKEKEKIMQDFKNKKIDILVSTSVIEVGIDIPNASVMLIEGVERFGLSQLHQFRGRVGRARHQSYCFLFTDSLSKKTRQRLKALLTCENGFELAEKDLEIRGPGDFIGTRQWGMPDLAMSSLKNLELVEKTRQAAKNILEKDINLKKYPFLAQKISRIQKRVHLE